MTLASTPPRPILCENLTLDFHQIASSHNTIGTIWRVAAIVCAVAAAALIIFVFISQFSATVSLLESVLLFGSSIGITTLVVNLIWKGSSDEFAQSEFYAQVDQKITQLKAEWGRPQIEAFFNDHDIKLPTAQAPLTFLPTIAHFLVLQETTPPVQLGREYTISNAQRGLHQLNLAMILQSLHRPTENITMKLNARLIDRIDHVGGFDMPGVIKKMYEGKSTEAFFFEEKGREPLTLDLLNTLKPEALRTNIFDNSILDQVD